MIPTGLHFGREVCGDLSIAEGREWLVTNGIGGYASGTVAGVLTRRYHGLLVAALKPPLGRTLMLTSLDGTVSYGDRLYPLAAHRWADGSVGPSGYRHIESFGLEGTVPVWRYAIADALLERRIWMQPGENTTYVYYQVVRASQPLCLTVKAMVNYRDHHHLTQAQGWKMTVESVTQGICVSAFPEAMPLRLMSDRADASPSHDWYYGFELEQERDRGLDHQDDHLHAASFQATLQQGDAVTFVAGLEQQLNLDGESALRQRRAYEQKLLNLWRTNQPQEVPNSVRQLVLAADQFVVQRPTPVELLNPTLQPKPIQGKTILAGYPWFSDWGRDTMISLAGLTLSTGRPEVARQILRTYGDYVSAGMLPNRFPDVGQTPDYNTVDATLWYFEALRAYYAATQDDDLVQDLFPVLAQIIDAHCRGTRYQIHLDPTDGLLYAGESGTQLTWMDAKVGDWVVTPRIGKPVEVNALWYNALRTTAYLARCIQKPHQEYDAIADRTLARFSRFWNSRLGYCYDVIDGPAGDDDALRPNQILAISLPESPLTPTQQKQVMLACGRSLLTSHGLRSLDPDHPNYQGDYRGTPLERDRAYHQGTVWGWLLGPYAIAHLRVFGNPAQARQVLLPLLDQLGTHGVGSLSEIFQGDAPMKPQGCIAQAWTVAEVLRAWVATELAE